MVAAWSSRTVGERHGDLITDPADLHQMGPAVQRLVHEGASYWGVGPNYAEREGDGALRRALGLNDDPPTSGPVSMDEYPRRVAEIGVGIAPLAQTAFNRAKSWLAGNPKPRRRPQYCRTFFRWLCPSRTRRWSPIHC